MIDWSRAGRRARPADPRLRAGPGRLDHLPRRAVQDQLAPGSRPDNLPPGALEVTKRSVQVGTATPGARARPGPGAGQEADAGRRLGARHHLRRDAGPRWLTWPERAGSPDRARRAAFDALRAVNSEGAYANLVLPTLLERAHGSAGATPAFATELLAGTCRRQGTYDLIIAAAAGRALKTLQPAVLDLLRLGTHQLLAMRVPQHAAVAATVDLAAATVGERVTGLVNAVLRRVAARDLTAGWTDGSSAGLDDRDALALRTAHPRWIVDAYADLLPAEELETALAANNAQPAGQPGGPAGARRRSTSWSRPGPSPGVHSPFARSLDRQPGRAGRGPRGSGRRAGRGLPARRLGHWPAPTAPAGWWLDLCAGPGRQDRAAGRPGRRGRQLGPGRGRSPRTGPPWSARRSGAYADAAERGRRRRHPTAPGAPARSPGCWPTCRAPGWARCAAGRRSRWRRDADRRRATAPAAAGVC